MKKRYLGIICLLYSGIIAYVWIFKLINNYISLYMQFYLKISMFIFLLIGIILVLIKDHPINLKLLI